MKTKMKAHSEQARVQKCAEGILHLAFRSDTETQLSRVFDQGIVTVKPLPPVNSTAKISPSSSNPFKWWGISADLLYLGIKPAMQEQEGKKKKIEFSLIQHWDLFSCAMK